MRIQPIHILTVTLGAAALLLAGVNDTRPAASAQVAHEAGNAAFRDGQYLAKLDVQAGRKPHLSTGRWSNTQDRAAFLAGYQQIYGSHTLPASSAERTGYSEGLIDGAEHRKDDRPFAAAKTINYRNAGEFRGQAEANGYRRGYSNGYQQAYYSDSDIRTLSEMRIGR